MIINQHKQVNLRDKIYFLNEWLDEEHDESELEVQLFDALWMLERCQDALIKLEDEDWDKLNLDFEFIL